MLEWRLSRRVRILAGRWVPGSEQQWLPHIRVRAPFEEYGTRRIACDWLSMWMDVHIRPSRKES